MEQVRLGKSGLHVSRLGLGMMSYGEDANRPWMLDEAAAEPIVRRAVEGGFTFFDTADMYSNGASEVATGRRWTTSTCTRSIAGTRRRRSRRRWRRYTTSRCPARRAS